MTSPALTWEADGDSGGGHTGLGQPEAAAYLARKATEGKTRREARRAHKRHLANRIIRRMWRDETTRQHTRIPAA